MPPRPGPAAPRHAGAAARPRRLRRRAAPWRGSGARRGSGRQTRAGHRRPRRPRAGACRRRWPARPGERPAVQHATWTAPRRARMRAGGLTSCGAGPR
ncbi:MAG: hypothetical protein DRQ55_13330 [Planctomycetota bacterium]|nr:MAG: hypothetical protein DRQ55_13330 [Planctomycetota bacterium]